MSQFKIKEKLINNKDGYFFVSQNKSLSDKFKLKKKVRESLKLKIHM